MAESCKLPKSRIMFLPKVGGTYLQIKLDCRKGVSEGVEFFIIRACRLRLNRPFFHGRPLSVWHYVSLVSLEWYVQKMMHSPPTP